MLFILGVGVVNKSLSETIIIVIAVVIFVNDVVLVVNVVFIFGCGQ